MLVYDENGNQNSSNSKESRNMEILQTEGIDTTENEN